MLFLRCELCKSQMPLKSNKAINEELERISKYLKPKDDPAQHAAGCSNSNAHFYTDPKAFRYNGVTPTGKTKRYQCKTCRQSFSVEPSPILRQKTSHMNKWFFKLLVNKVPFQRICELLEIDMPTLYRKIDFLHRQCMAFVAEREQKLLEGEQLVNGKQKPESIYVAIDRQEYSVNWKTLVGERGSLGGEKIDRRNIILDAIGSADAKTGYVFGMHLNFDPEMDTDDINNFKVKKNGDLQAFHGYREFARLWLQIDYQERLESNRKPKRDAVSSVGEALEDDYEDLRDRLEDGDVESPELMTETKKLPDRGMQVHEEYTMYAHLFLLKRMFSGIKKIRFFMDRESSIRAACHAAFADEINDGRFEGFFIKTHKTMTNPQKQRAYAEAVARFKDYQADNPGKPAREIRLLMLRDAMEHMVVRGDYKDKYLVHPFPDMSEPEKEVCHLNDTGRYKGSEDDRNHLAWLYGKASLHAINRFFMQLRRRVSLLERPLHSAASTRRTWFGYSPYDPGNIQKVTDIFRVFYNYIKVTPAPQRKKTPSPFYVDLDSSTSLDVAAPLGEEDPDADRVTGIAPPEKGSSKKKGKAGTTPAMRFGLAKAPVRYKDILYFRQ